MIAKEWSTDLMSRTGDFVVITTREKFDGLGGRWFTTTIHGGVLDGKKWLTVKRSSAESIHAKVEQWAKTR